ncbi:MAG: recombinase family protein [Actinobacteria bacterium]|nr:recombinase family protein [Actinomycetota bacterium]
MDDDKESTRKVSHIAQTEEGVRWAQSRGFDVVGTFEDLGVSAGKTTPFERPELGEWLSPQRLHEWDVLVFSKIDRAFRSTNDCVEFAKWTKDNRRILAFSGDGVVLDYLNPAGDSLDQMMSEFFIYVGSFFAAIELARFKTRATDRLAVLKMTDRVSHGVAPLGFKTVQHPSGIGKALARDHEGFALLHEIQAKLVHEGQSLTEVVRWLNDSGHRTNHAKVAGKGKWSVTTLKRTLTSQRLQGLRVSGGQVVLDPHGQPIKMAEPTFTNAEWVQLQDAIAQRSASGRHRQMSPNPLSGIGYCGCILHTADCEYPQTWVPRRCDCPECGYALALHRRRSTSGKTHTYVRCGRQVTGCRGAMRLDDVEESLQGRFLEDYGDREMTRRVFVPGEDHSAELAQTEQSLERLRWESDSGLVDDEELYRSRLSALVARKAELSANLIVPARWDYVGTGQTYRELWDDPSTDRRQVLRDSGIKFMLFGLPHGSSGSTRAILSGYRVPESWPAPSLTSEQRHTRDTLAKL